MSIKLKLLIINLVLFVIVTGCAIALYVSQGVSFSKDSAGTVTQKDYVTINGAFEYIKTNVTVDKANQQTFYEHANNQLNNEGAEYKIIVLARDGTIVFSQSAQNSVDYCLSLSDFTEIENTLYATDNLMIFHKALPDLDIEIFAISDSVAYYAQSYTVSLAWVIIMMVTFACLFLICYFLEQNTIFPELNRLRGGLRQISRGKMDFQLVQTSRDEIGVLCKEFEDMRLKLVQLETQKRELDNKRNDIIAGITHDIKTPITTICAYSKGLMDGIARTDEKRQKYYTTINTTALGLNDLLDRLKDFSNINSDQRQLNMVYTNMTEFVDTFIKENTLVYKERGAKIIAVLPKKAVYANIDRMEFVRIFHNIINNSIKYKQKEVAEITISLTAREGFVILIIADDGPGLEDKNDLNHIFDSYFRGNIARTNPTKEGSGLGLAIVKNITLLHNGDVKANSDKGLSIIITLPEGEKK